jgi:hypothetical protein
MALRLLRVGALLGVALLASCHHRKPSDIPSRPVSKEGAGFVGTIYDVRLQMIMAEEESALKSRRGEIWISPSTEIVSRTGMLMPIETLRRGMRVTVWFTTDFTETDNNVQGRARRIVVEY